MPSPRRWPESAREETELVRHMLLPETPVWATLLYLVLAAGWLALYGVEPLARLAFLIMPLGYAVIVVFALAMLWQGEVSRLAPLLSDGWSPVLRGALAVARQQEGIAAVPLVFGAFAVPARRVPPMVLLGMGLAFFPLLLNTLAVLAQLGTAAVDDYAWPGLAALQNIVLPGFLLEKPDIFFLSVWLLFGFSSVAVFYILEVTVLERLLNCNRAWLVAGTGALFLVLPVLSDLLVPFLEAAERFRTLYLSLVFLYALPALLLAVSALRGRRGPAAADRGPAAGERV